MLALVLLQAVIFNNVNVFGLITPYIYIYFVLNLETNMPRNTALLWAFAIGILVDMFSDTPGVNAAASVFTAFTRLFVLRLYVPRETAEQTVPSIRNFGLMGFAKYEFTAVALHHAIVVSLCYFSFSNFGELLLRISLSTLLTGVLILVIDNIKK